MGITVHRFRDVSRHWTATVLSLLDSPFVFTQHQALTVQQFSNELRRRNVGSWPESGQLEAFHRLGLLVPLYAINYDVQVIRSRARAQGEVLTRKDIRDLLDFTNTNGPGLLAERQVGDLRSPSQEAYRPWRRELRKFAGRPYRTRQYLYSYHQLLATPLIAGLWPHLRLRRRIWHLDLHPVVLQRSLADAGFTARLLRPLTILEPPYLPDIIEKVSMPGFGDFDGWEAFRSEFDAPATLSRLGWSAPQVLQAAEDLMTRAHGMDPVAAWHELTRLVHPSFWEKLEGDARTAMDYRLAGEILLRFYEDLAASGLAPPLEPLSGRWWHPRLERLKSDRSELDTTLTRFGLSPHPAVVLIVEGEVEKRIVPLVLDQLYDGRWRTRIRVFNVQGVHQSLNALAAFVAVPDVIQADRDFIPLARPPTRFVVLSDAEGPNAESRGREQRRQMWVRRIHDELPAEMRAEIDESELDGLVRMIVWNEEGFAFEYAHFTDAELADGLLAIAPSGPPRDEVVRRVAGARARRANLKVVWALDWAPPKPRKPALAMHLWPGLSALIEAARSGSSAIPIAVLAAAREVMALAGQYPRQHGVVLRRRGRPEPSSSSEPEPTAGKAE